MQPGMKRKPGDRRETARPAARRAATSSLGAGLGAAGTLWRSMSVFSIFVAVGIALSLAGLAGVAWCIRVAARLKRADLPDDAVRSELGRLMFAHTAAIGAAFLGLGLLAVGLLLQ